MPMRKTQFFALFYRFFTLEIWLSKNSQNLKNHVSKRWHKTPFYSLKQKRLVESVAALLSLLTWNKNHIFQELTSSLFHNLRTLLKIEEGRLNLNLRNLIQILSQKFRDFTFENLLGCSWKILYHVAKIISPKIEKNRKIFFQTLLRIVRVLYQELFPVRTLTCS